MLDQHHTAQPVPQGHRSASEEMQGAVEWESQFGPPCPPRKAEPVREVTLWWHRGSVPSTAGQTRQGFGASQGNSQCKALAPPPGNDPRVPSVPGSDHDRGTHSAQDRSPRARGALQGQGCLLWGEALQDTSAVESLQPLQTCRSCPGSGSLGALGDLLGRVFGPFPPPCRFFT